MSDHSIFMDKFQIPDQNALKEALGDLYPSWEKIRLKVYELYPKAFEEWNFPGQKYGWSFRVKDKKRPIIYLLPRDGFFKAAFVFGDKAVEKIMVSQVNNNIKTALSEARKYAEGRGIRIDIKDETLLPDIYTLMEIKIKGS